MSSASEYDAVNIAARCAAKGSDGNRCSSGMMWQREQC